MPEFENKIAVVLNKKIEVGRAMNALAHTMLGFGANVADKEKLRLIKYTDSEGNVHANISEMPNVILRGKSGQIQNLRKQAIESKVQFVDFIDTMSMGTYEEELAITKERKDEDMDYWAIVLFGPFDVITDLTKKFSVYK
jgi:hypothetical protein